MDSLATIARQRTLVTTVADAIVAAAAGKSLRVAIGWNDPDEATFADQLHRALLARGLPCRSLSHRCAPRPDGSPAGPPMVAVITSGTADPHDSELCRIDIYLRSPGDEADRCAADDGHRPDVVIDYLDPDGPTIRHLAPALAPPSDRL